DFDLRPGEAIVMRIGLDNSSYGLRRARVQPDMLAAQIHQRRLDDAVRLTGFRLRDREITRCGNRADSLPRQPVVRAPLNPARPGFIALNRTAAENSPVLQHKRLGADRSIETGGKMLHRSPGAPLIAGVGAAR